MLDSSSIRASRSRLIAVRMARQGGVHVRLGERGERLVRGRVEGLRRPYGRRTPTCSAQGRDEQTTSNVRTASAPVSASNAAVSRGAGAEGVLAGSLTGPPSQVCDDSVPIRARRVAAMAA